MAADILRWTTVDSSNVARIRYWKKTKEMDVQFKTAPEYFYRYSDVSMVEFIDTLQADSIGGHFSKEIKASKDVKKLRHEF